MSLPKNIQKEQLSFAYIYSVAAKAGFNCDSPKYDFDSVDVTVGAVGLFGKNAVFRSPRIEIQAKATSKLSLNRDGETFSFSLPVKNYDDLRLETHIPRILVVYRMPEAEQDWLKQSEDNLSLHHCAYWVSLLGSEETTNTDSVTVHIPKSQVFTVGTLNTLMEKVARRESL